jgi:arsenate reductase-like glutaredoxin family protein
MEPTSTPEITVYTSGPRCVDCNTIKRWLSQNGYSFTERNIREDPAALAELHRLGYQSVPVTRIDNTIIDGLELDAIQAALARYA